MVALGAVRSAARAERFVVSYSIKLVDRLNLGFLLPVEVLPGAWRQVQQQLAAMGGTAELRPAQRKAGPWSLTRAISFLT